MKKLIYPLIFSVLLVSCDKEEAEEPLSSAEAQAAIEATAAAAAEDLIDLAESEGLLSLEEAIGFIELFEHQFQDYRMDRSTLDLKGVLNMVKPLNLRLSDSEPEFDMPTGIFDWNSTTSEFDFSDESDLFILNYPSGESSSNNGSFVISEVSFSEDGSPEAVDLAVSIDGTTMFGIDASINWSSLGYPEDGELDIVVSPFSMNAGLNLTDGLGTTFSLVLNKNSEQIANIGLSTDVSILMLGITETLPDVDVNLHYRDLGLAGSLALSELDEDSEEDVDPNDVVDLELSIDREVVGELVFIYENIESDYSEYVPYVQFTNGDQVAVEDLLFIFLEAFEGAFEEDSE